MADLQFSVVSDSRQAQADMQRLAKSVGQIEQSTKSVTTGFITLAKTVAVTVAAFSSLDVLTRLSDSATNLNNKLRLVTDSTKELTAAQSILSDTAIETRSTLASSVSIYSSFAKSLDRTKSSMLEMASATSIVQQSIALSGATADSANAAIIQLGQGLSSGVLRGEELNSVMEQTSRLGQAIADGMGVTKGQLRDIAAEGKLTSDTVFAAILSQAQQINKEFSKTQFTVSAAFGQFSDALSTVIGGSVLATGVTSKLANTISSLSTNVREFNLQAETYGLLAAISIKEAIRNISQIFQIAKPLFAAMYTRMLDFVPVVNLLQMKIAGMFAYAAVDKFLTKAREVGNYFQELSKSSDVLRDILTNTKMDKVVDRTMGYRIRDMFASKSIVEFKDNVEIVTNLLKSGTERTWLTSIKDTFAPRALYDFLFKMEDVLSVLGLVDDKFIRIGNIRFDGLKSTLGDIQIAVSEIIDKDLGGTLARSMQAVKMGLYGVALYLQQIGERYDNVFGRLISSVGVLITSLLGIPQAIRYAGQILQKMIETAAEIAVLDAAFAGIIKIVGRLTQVTKVAVKGVSSFEYPLAVIGKMGAVVASVNHGFSGTLALLKEIWYTTSGVATALVSSAGKLGALTFVKPLQQLGEYSSSLARVSKLPQIGYDKVSKYKMKSGAPDITDIYPLGSFSKISTEIPRVASIFEKLPYVIGYTLSSSLKFIASFFKGVFAEYNKNGFTTGLFVPILKSMRKVAIFEIGLSSFSRLIAIVSNQISDLIYSLIGTPFQLALSRFVSGFVEAITLIWTAIKSSDVGQKIGNALRLDVVVGYVRSMAAKIGESFTFQSIYRYIQRFTEGVANLFFIVYDAVVGHSYWPDMVEGVLDWSRYLYTEGSRIISKFTKFVGNSFRSMLEDNGEGWLGSTTDTLEKLLAKIKKTAISVVKSIGGFELANPFAGKEDTLSRFLPTKLADKIANATNEAVESTSRLVAVGAITAIAAALFPAVRLAIGTFLGVQLMLMVVKGAESAFNEFAGASIFNQMGQTIGTAVGFYIVSAVKAIPQTIQLAFSTLEGFGEGLINEFGALGSVIRGIFDLFSAGEGNLVVGLLGGAAGLTMLLKGKAAIQGLVTALLGTTKLKDRTIVDSVMNSIFGKTDRVLLTAGITVLFTALTDQVNILQASFIGFPLIMAAILGRDVTRKIILDTIKSLFLKVGAMFSAYTAASSSKGTLLSGLFGTRAEDVRKAANDAGKAVGKIFGAVASATDEDNQKKYLAGEMSLSSLFSSGKDTKPLTSPIIQFDESYLRGRAEKAGLSTSAAFKSGIDKNKSGLSLITSIGGTSAQKDAILKDTTSFGERVSDALKGVSDKWAKISAEKKAKWAKVAIGAGLVTAGAVYTSDANAATQSFEATMSSTTQKIGSSFSKLGDMIANNLQEITLVVTLALASWQLMAHGSWSGAFKNLAATVVSGMQASTVGAAILRMFAGLSGYIAGGLALLGVTLVTALWVLAAVAVVAVGGIVGVMLFGEGNSLEEKFQNARLMVEELLDFKEVNRGRKGELMAKLRYATELQSSVNPNAKALSDYRVGSIDLNKISDRSYNQLSGLADKLAALSVTAENERAIDGSVSDNLRDDIDKLINQFSRVLDNAEVKGIKDGLQGLVKSLEINSGRAVLKPAEVAPDPSMASIITASGPYGMYGAPQFGAAEIRALLDAAYSALNKQVEDISKYTDKFTPEFAALMERNLQVVDVEIKQMYMRAANRLQEAQRDFRAEEDKGVGNLFGMGINPAKLNKLRDGLADASGEFDSMSSRLNELADSARNAAKHQENIKALVTNIAKVGGTLKEQDARAIGDRVLEINSRISSILVLESQAAKAGPAESKAMQLQADKMKDVLLNKVIPESQAGNLLGANMKYFSDKSGLTIEESSLTRLGEANLSRLKSLQLEALRLKREMGTITVGSPGSMESYLGYQAEILRNAKEAKAIIESTKPPAALMEYMASEAGLSVNKDDVARYSPRGKSYVASTSAANKLDMDAIDSLQTKIADMKLGDPNRGLLMMEQAKLEGQIAIRKARFNHVLGKMNEGIAIRDNVDEFNYQLKEANQSINWEDFLRIPDSLRESIATRIGGGFRKLVDRLNFSKFIKTQLVALTAKDTYSKEIKSATSTAVSLFSEMFSSIGMEIREFSQLPPVLREVVLKWGKSIRDLKDKQEELRGEGNMVAAAKLGEDIGKSQSGLSSFLTSNKPLLSQVENMAKELGITLSQIDYIRLSDNAKSSLDGYYRAIVTANAAFEESDKGDEAIAARAKAIAASQKGAAITTDGPLEYYSKLIGISAEVSDKLLLMGTSYRSLASDMQFSADSFGRFTELRSKLKLGLLSESEIAEFRKLVEDRAALQLKVKRIELELDSDKTMEEFQSRLSKSGLNLDPVVSAGLSESARRNLSSRSRQFIRAEFDYKNAAPGSDAAKAAADQMKQSSEYFKSIDKLLATINSFKESLNTASTNFIKGVLTGKEGSSKELLMSVSSSILDAASARINDFLFKDLINSFTDTMFGSVSELGSESNPMWVQWGGMPSAPGETTTGDFSRMDRGQTPSVGLKDLANPKSLLDKFANPKSLLDKFAKPAMEQLNKVVGDMFKGLMDSLRGVLSDLGRSLMNSLPGWFSIRGSAATAPVLDASGGSAATVFAASGGYISGPGSAVSDSIPAMLSNGEYVVNARSTAKYGKLLESINSGAMPKFADGGLVSPSLYSIAPAASLGMSERAGVTNNRHQVINVNITGDISRQTKSEISKMLPSIAEGVNLHNREKGYR